MFEDYADRIAYVAAGAWVTFLASYALLLVTVDRAPGKKGETVWRVYLNARRRSAERRSAMRFMLVYLLLMLSLFVTWALSTVATVFILRGWIDALTASSLVVPLAVIAAVYLYRKRGTARLSYGVIELTVALGLLVLIPFDVTSDPLNRLVATIAAVYVLIRGLDNLGSGLEGDEREVWERLFPDRTPTK